MTNQINTINLDNVQELLNFGNEAMEQMREITNNISSKLDTQITNIDIIPSINKVMKVIDYDELNKLNQKANNKFLKVIGMATQAKEKIFNKYALVIKNIDNMYFGVNAYKNNVISSTAILTELKENTIKLKETLNNQINFGYEILKSITENEMVKTDQVTDTVVEEKEILWDDVCSQEEKINDIVINAVQKNLDWILKYRKEVVNLDRIQQLLNEICPDYTQADINYRQKWGTVPNLMRNTKYKLYIDGDLRLPTWEYDNDTTIINIHLTINNVYCHLDVIIGKGGRKTKSKRLLLFWFRKMVFNC